MAATALNRAHITKSQCIAASGERLVIAVRVYGRQMTVSCSLR